MTTENKIKKAFDGLEIPKSINMQFIYFPDLKLTLEKNFKCLKKAKGYHRESIINNLIDIYKHITNHK